MILLICIYSICLYMGVCVCASTDSMKCINIKLETQILPQRLLLQSKDTIDDRRLRITVH